MNRLLSITIAALLTVVATPAFAACGFYQEPRDIDRPVASTTNADRTGPVLDGADYTDWETIAYTTPLARTTGGFELVSFTYDPATKQRGCSI